MVYLQRVFLDKTGLQLNIRFNLEVPQNKYEAFEISIEENLYNIPITNSEELMSDILEIKNPQNRLYNISGRYKIAGEWNMVQCLLLYPQEARIQSTIPIGHNERIGSIDFIGG
jgi:hypothetical protein